jgi:hypothetical protein
MPSRTASMLRRMEDIKDPPKLLALELLTELCVIVDGLTLSMVPIGVQEGRSQSMLGLYS